MGRETCRTSSALKILLLHLHVVLTHLRPAAIVRMPEITDNAPLCGYTADVVAFVKHLQSGANRHDTSRPALQPRSSASLPAGLWGGCLSWTANTPRSDPDDADEPRLVYTPTDSIRSQETDRTGKRVTPHSNQCI